MKSTRYSHSNEIEKNKCEYRRFNNELTEIHNGNGWKRSRCKMNGKKRKIVISMIRWFHYFCWPNNCVYPFRMSAKDWHLSGMMQISCCIANSIAIILVIWWHLNDNKKNHALHFSMAFKWNPFYDLIPIPLKRPIKLHTLISGWEQKIRKLGQ